MELSGRYFGSAKLRWPSFESMSYSHTKAPEVSECILGATKSSVVFVVNLRFSMFSFVFSSAFDVTFARLFLGLHCKHSLHLICIIFLGLNPSFRLRIGLWKRHVVGVKSYKQVPLVARQGMTFCLKSA